VYAFVRSLGPDGMKEIGELSILNNNYMLKKLLEIKGLTLPWAPGKFRMEQARLSWEELTKETGVTTDDICRRILDYGFQDYFASHHPRVIPEPFTPEPVESYSKDDIDEFVAAFKAIAQEARTNPKLVKTAPHKAALATQIDESGLTSWKKFATTWRAYKKYVAKKR
jgi:glycine dehydrogenase subunit 2